MNIITMIKQGRMR